MRRHIAPLPVFGRTGSVGLRSATHLNNDPPSSSKSPSTLPKGRREIRSRFVQVVRTDKTVASGFAGRIDKSTSDKKVSVPSSFGRVEGRRLAIQKHVCS